MYNGRMNGRAPLRGPVLAVIAALALAGCASLKEFQKKHFPKKAEPPPKALPAAKPAVPRVDAKAQQQAYDEGMRLYSEEKYREAKQAWQRAVRHGPATELGRKAQEHLQKTEQILQNLKEIEAQ